jgi:hypothetical protein
MKRASVLFTCLLITGFSAMAQRGNDGNRQSPQERAERQAKVMKVDLDLSPAQYEKLLTLNLKRSEEATAKRTEMKKEMEGNREAMKAEREVYKAELKIILTPEQFEEHEAMMKERMEKRGKGRGGDKPQQRQRGRN